MRVLISGFDAFGEYQVNPTALIVDALNQGLISYPSSLKVEQILLPVTFKESFEKFEKKIESFNPDVVISFGVANRDSIELESVAINFIDARIKDNAGAQPREQQINPEGSPTYLSTLPLQGIESRLKAAKIPVKISNDAGAYVCNYLFYRLMEINQDSFRLCGFIHVPPLETMPLNQLQEAVSHILHYIDY